MALETVRVAVDDTAYVKVGDNITALTMTEKLVGDMRVVALPNGSSAPAVGETDYLEWDKEFSFSGTAADVYVLSPNGASFVGVVRD